MSELFDFDRLLQAASTETALTDFGDPSFREPLRQLLWSLEHEADLNDTGQAVLRQRIFEILCNRLRVQAFIERYPEILEEEITAPLVIVGLPRTGTTMLHRTIAADPRFMAPLWYEVRFPTPGLDWDFQSPDPRIAAATAEMDAMLAASPDLTAIHPMDPVGPDEEIMLLEQSFYSYMPESQANVPSYEKWLQQADHAPGYRYLKLLLQFLQWQKKRAGQSGHRWVLKAPHHIHFIDLVLKVFPDAKIVQSHRDPVQTIPSLASLIFAVWKIYSDSADPTIAGKMWARKFANGTFKTMQLRQYLGSAQFLDLWFSDAVANPLQEIKKIYDFIGLELTEEARKEMLAWQEFNRRELRPSHEYTLEEFGLTEAGLQKQFFEYRKQFIEKRLKK